MRRQSSALFFWKIIKLNEDNRFTTKFVQTKMKQLLSSNFLLADCFRKDCGFSNRGKIFDLYNFLLFF
ncbi:colicin immunity domain-containing protein [Bacillus sp. 2205SS5-2]|uniref:colicin immunity domain-containing protein n=1 Tax=Bacillus sp. 2205SS5-2 TaxID=3109031 RepID=UPI003FA5A431